MKKIILMLSIIVSHSAHAETTSMDITMTDIKEATYKLIKDVSSMKRMQAGPSQKTEALIKKLEERQRKLSALLNELEEKQKNILYVKKFDDANDVYIRDFVKNNHSMLLVK